MVNHERLTDDVKRADLAPHQSWSERTPILVFPARCRQPGDYAVCGHGLRVS